MRTKHDKAFKAEAVKLAITGEKSISQTAKDLGVHETTLYNWVAKASESKIPYCDEDSIKSAVEVIDGLKQLRGEKALCMHFSFLYRKTLWASSLSTTTPIC